MATQVQKTRPSNERPTLVGIQHTEQEIAKRALMRIHEEIEKVGAPKDRLAAANRGEHLALLSYDFGNPNVLDAVAKNLKTPANAIDRIGKIAFVAPDFGPYMGVASTIIVQKRASAPIREKLSKRMEETKLNAKDAKGSSAEPVSTSERTSTLFVPLLRRPASQISQYASGD